jgi:AcrR family transcriptional regulator
MGAEQQADAIMQNQQLLERVYRGKRFALKRQILAEALQCFLEQGIETATIEMIRERSGASVGAIYHHFKHKEGLVAALYVCAIQDQAERRDRSLLSAQNLQQGIQIIIASYIDWVMDYPDFARFLYAAHFSISKSAQQEELKQKNAARNQHLLAWMKQQQDYAVIQQVPHELFLSLMVGSTESYCRAWLSGRVKTAPQSYKAAFALAAWSGFEQLQAQNAAAE